PPLVHAGARTHPWRATVPRRIEREPVAGARVGAARLWSFERATDLAAGVVGLHDDDCRRSGDLRQFLPRSARHVRLADRQGDKVNQLDVPTRSPQRKQGMSFALLALRATRPNLLTLLFLLLLLAIYGRPFADLDFTWQVRTGGEIVRSGKLRVE